MHLRHKLVLSIAISLAFVQPSAHADSALFEGGKTGESQDQTKHQDTLVTELEALFALAEKDQEEADRALEKLLADPRFGAQSPDLQHDAYSLSTWLALQRQDYGKALQRSRQRVAANANEIEDWHLLAALELDAGNREAAAKAVVRLAQQWPDKIEGLEINLLAQLLRPQLEAPARQELLQALTQAGWRRGRIENSQLWYELTLAQLLDGKIESARESAQHIFSPGNIIQLRSDKQFDSLIDRNSPRFDVALAAQALVGNLQRLAGESPDSLELRNELNDAMLTAGMTQAALVHSDLILAKLAQLSEDDPSFADTEAKNWTMNNRAVALRRLGRPDEAIKQLTVASKLDEHGQANINQILNLAQFYCSMGRPLEAQATVEQVGENLSPYGSMVKASTEHRIALQMKDPAAEKKAMAYLREHRKDSHSLYFWALLETQQLDQAADLLKGLLAIPEDRGEALSWAQQVQRSEPLSADVSTMANLKAVLARADIQAAITQVGYVEHYPVFTGYMSD